MPSRSTNVQGGGNTMRGPFLRWTDEGFGRDCSGGRERNKFYRASLNLWVVRIELLGRVVIHRLNNEPLANRAHFAPPIRRYFRAGPSAFYRRCRGRHVS
jgi:hypothetical protein